MHVARGNSAARLVVSYCNRQTDWENPHDERCLSLAADLHQSYPEAVKHLIGSSQGRLERAWLNSKTEESYVLFLLQNKSAVAMLKELDGMASVKASILSNLPSLPRDNIEHKRAYLDLSPSGWEQFEGENWWPFVLNVRHADIAKSKYTLALCWNAKDARTEAEAENLRQRLTLVESQFGKHEGSHVRRVVLGRLLTLNDLLQRLATLDAKLRRALA